MANFQTFQILSCLLSSFQAQTLCLIATPAFSEQIVWSKYAANNKDLRLPRSQATRHQTTKRKVPFPNDLEHNDPQEQGVSSLAASCRFPPRDNCTTSSNWLTRTRGYGHRQKNGIGSDLTLQLKGRVSLNFFILS